MMSWMTTFGLLGWLLVIGLLVAILIVLVKLLHRDDDCRYPDRARTEFLHAREA
jgi:hypothetical protein